jgi:hypothetical protein
MSSTVQTSVTSQHGFMRDLILIMATIVEQAIESEPAPETDLLSIAQKSIESSRQAVERLIGSIPLDDQFSLGVLGPILAGLRDIERELKGLS